jgi:hypothetical protein
MDADTPAQALRRLTPPYIRPVPEGDQQPNPAAGKVHFHLRKLTPQDEIQVVADSLANGCLTIQMGQRRCWCRATSAASS